MEGVGIESTCAAFFVSSPDALVAIVQVLAPDTLGLMGLANIPLDTATDLVGLPALLLGAPEPPHAP